ncbi:MAG: hypothetical protein A3E85_04485 [Gammaproteobacteria bacterium RIFCSPHIGHO2_12_FULL_45_12]|nr:MAG: hypothetical protein A3E85_04485 [Gammaproteobacteria bacterium RIFCSPHIGHO2_12_FULL_45_12]
MKFRLLGSILLIVGSSIGAGMLALPLATSQLGFLGSVGLLFLCWFVMTAGGLLILEVNLWLPQSSHLISMAKATIGPVGQLLSWIMYLLLLYSLLCAYIAGGSDLFHHLFLSSHFAFPRWVASVLFTGLLGLVVFLGIHAVDYANRVLMMVKLGAFVSLAFCLAPFISAKHLMASGFSGATFAAALTVTVTSFGFSAIVPSLRVYFAGNVKKLRMAIIVGSLIPLVCYIVWDAAIMGVIPRGGQHGLMAVLHSTNATSDLVNTISAVASHGAVTLFAKLFTSVCVVTSFIGVALCLSDFLADGLQLEKKGMGGVVIHLMVLMPPLLLVLFYPHVFVKALVYAGIYCVVLLVFIPACMAWVGRYHRHKTSESGYRVAGGKPLLLFLLGFSLLTVVWGLIG